MPDARLQELYRTIDDQIRKEKAKAKQRAPNGDRRMGPGTPPQGIDERRAGQDRRQRPRSPRDKDKEE